MLYVGIACIVLALILVIIRVFQAKQLFQYQATETSTVESLNQVAQDMQNDIGKGSFIQKAEVKGICTSDTPLTADFSGTSCVYYACRVIREYEERKTVTDSEGHHHEETVRGSETVQSTERSVRFTIKDTTGVVHVVPDGAKFITERSFSRYEHSEPQGGRLNLGGMTINLGVFSPLAHGRRTIGYRYEEESIPVGRSLYILGEANDKEGFINITKPTSNKDAFVISVKSEEELIRNSKNAVLALAVAAGVSSLLGIALIIYSLFAVK